MKQVLMKAQWKNCANGTFQIVDDSTAVYLERYGFATIYRDMPDSVSSSISELQPAEPPRRGRPRKNGGERIEFATNEPDSETGMK